MYEIYSSADAATAMLKGVRRKMRQKGKIAPSEALLLYAALPMEEGFGGRVFHNPILRKRQVVEPGIRGLKDTCDAYAAQAILLCNGHAQLDGALGVQVLAGLVEMRRLIDRTILVLETCCSGLDLALAAQVEGIEYAARDVDATIMEDAIGLLPLVGRVQDSLAKSAALSTKVPLASLTVWWDTDTVPWWKSLRMWAKDGVSDADHAGNWLFPALHRASEKAATAKRKKR